MSVVEDQNAKLQTEIESVNAQLTSYERKNDYQYEMYSNLKILNTVLVFFYLFLFTLIHVLFLEQYLRGVERSEFWDSIWLTVFFLYPYLMYLFEQGVYFCITYILAYLYGKTYVYDFNKLVMGSMYYTDAIPSSIVNTQPENAEEAEKPAQEPEPPETPTPTVFNTTSNLRIDIVRNNLIIEIKNNIIIIYAKHPSTDVTLIFTDFGKWLSSDIFVTNNSANLIIYQFADNNNVVIYNSNQDINYVSITEKEVDEMIKTLDTNFIQRATYSGTK
jgi:hypothetical protein